MEKHHYRKVFKSDHLGIADLEDLIEENKSLVFTIKEVRQELNVSVAGKKGNFNIAYFTEALKPLVLNATNSKQVKTFAGGSPFVEDWKNIPIELFIDENVKMKGEIVGGVRIRPIQPTIGSKPKPQFTSANFEAAKKKDATIAQIKTLYEISPKIEAEYNAYKLPEHETA